MTHASSTAGAPALSIRDLRKTYDGGGAKRGVEALKGVSLDVMPGDFFALDRVPVGAASDVVSGPVAGHDIVQLLVQTS